MLLNWWLRREYFVSKGLLLVVAWNVNFSISVRSTFNTLLFVRKKFHKFSPKVLTLLENVLSQFKNKI